MNFNIDVLKKKISYRSTYRGTKEMDLLLSSFVKDIIDELNQDELIKLLAFLKLDDENLYKFNQGIKTNISIEKNEITNLFKKYKLK
jgi:antitoxin CptB|tara:strand:- start:13 stop:273 length:261 start_codon:yes stop_codon:yes gene_type:complete